MDSPPPSFLRRWSRRIARAALVLVLLAWPLYLLVFNLLLGQRILPSLVEKAGPKVHMTYDKAWTFWPNRIHVRGFVFAIEDRAVRFLVASPEATLGLALDPRVWKERRVGLRHVRARDVQLKLSFLVPEDELSTTDLSLRPHIPQFDGPPVQVRKQLTPEMEAAELIWGVDIAGVQGSFSTIHINDVLVEGDLAVEGDFLYRLFDRLAFDVAADGPLSARLGRLVAFEALDLSGWSSLPLRHLPTDTPPELSGAVKLTSSAPAGLDSPLGRVTLGDLVVDVELDDAGWRGPIETPFQLAGREAIAPIDGHASARAGGDRVRGVLEQLEATLSGLYDLDRDVEDELQDRQNTKEHFAKEIEDEVRDMARTKERFAREIEDEVQDMARTKEHFAHKLRRLEAQREQRLAQAEDDAERAEITERFARRQARVEEERGEELVEDRQDLARERAKRDKELVEDREDLAAEERERDEELAEDAKDLAQELAERREQTWSMAVGSSRLTWGRIDRIGIRGPVHVQASRGSPLIRRVLPPDLPTPWAPLFPLKGLVVDAYLDTEGGGVTVTDIEASSEGVEAWGWMAVGGEGPRGELRLVAGPLGLLLDIDGQRAKAVKVTPKAPSALRGG